MSTRRNPSDEAAGAAFDKVGAHVVRIDLEEEIANSYLEYSYSVIHSRAIPDARDGMKPVHRRILYSMAEDGLRPDHAYVKSARVVGSCFVEGALVSTPSGLVPIEMLNVGDEVLAPNGQPVRVCVAYENPAREVVELVFSNGHTLVVTPDQLFQVVNDDYTKEWVRADALEGRRVVSRGTVVPSSVSEKFNTRINMTHEQGKAYTLGILVSEGSQVHRSRDADGRVQFSMVDPEPVDEVQRWVKNEGLNFSRTLKTKEKEHYQDAHLLRISRHPDLLSSTKEKSSSKTVPLEVLADKDSWIPFLAGFFDGDGYVRKGNRTEIVLVSVSQTLIRQLRSMLVGMGIMPGHWMREKVNEGEYDLHALTITGLNSIQLAKAFLPFSQIGYKREELSHVSRMDTSARYNTSDMLPCRALFTELSERHLGAGWYRDVDGVAFRQNVDGVGTPIRFGRQSNTGTPLLDRNFTLRRAQRDGWISKLERIGSPLAGRLSDLSGASFLTVAAVNKLDEHQVNFDIQVDSEDHAFLVEGFVVHNCMGRYHPHGDSAIYDALVRMSQDFALNTPVVDGHGNFGSPNDSAAASRYTECRLAKIAMTLVGELDEETVDFGPNYDGSLKEPSVLPAAYPYLLVNGAAGIAVGMATNMIPHNLGEVVAAARLLIKKPDASLDEIMVVLPGPDLPSGGVLIGMDEVRLAYETGKGTVRLRATVNVEALEGTRNRQGIIVSALPYGVGTEKVIESIKAEMGKKRLQGISDVKDLSDRVFGTRLLIECKTGVNPQVLLNDLWKYTPLETSFGISNLALVGGHPRTLGLKELLDVFLAHRYDVVTRRTQFRLRKAEARKHIIDGLLIALDNIDEVVKIIRGSKDTASARTALMKRFKLTDIQTGYILDTPLRRLVSLEVESLRKELKELLVAISGFEKILGDDKVLRKLVDDELAALSAEFAQPRKTMLMGGDLKEVLAASAPALGLEVSDDPCQVIVSTSGLLVRTAAKSEETVEGVKRRSARLKHDTVLCVCDTSARSQILLVSNKGRAFKVDVLSLPALPESSGVVSLRGGISASELVPLTSGEHLVTVAPLGAAAEGGLGIAMGTRQGIVKICAPDWPLRSDEFEVIGLKQGDEIVGATWVKSEAEELAFLTSDAQLLHFPAKIVRPQGRSGGGMAGIKLGPKDIVLTFTAVDMTVQKESAPMVVTFSGVSGKVTPLSEYPSKGRATGGVRAQRFLKGEERLELAWIGEQPAGATEKGEPVELPEVDNRRDASGMKIEGLGVIGRIIRR